MMGIPWRGPLSPAAPMLHVLRHYLPVRKTLLIGSELGLLTIQDMHQAVETLSGGQRQGVAVARAAAFGQRVVIMDETTAALSQKFSLSTTFTLRYDNNPLPDVEKLDTVTAVNLTYRFL